MRGTDFQDGQSNRPIGLKITAPSGGEKCRAFVGMLSARPDASRYELFYLRTETHTQRTKRCGTIRCVHL